MNKYSFIFLTVITTALLSTGSVVTNAFSSTSASVSYCPPICLDEVQQHVNDAKDALNDGKLVEAASELDIVSSLLDQLDDMTSKSE
ncbi:hypothetical protein NMY3_01704 [Candidatus Nitrosocosmicus oleophilus]|jgi:hypothetical protein|uniref:Uncharacterized protein n=1 Tax=Candidatus Nitrosocosmicus oleophilus TaxID=1353260 RepID=A0A654LY67_9ARCH|nr:hypothetical protein [Candidatus Nitrosocosmicus oleophilus]ALI35907.1 hypothetical protein NMY3_01704 [Candidatus Nitrosocosmicus oleophilus]